MKKLLILLALVLCLSLVGCGEKKENEDVRPVDEVETNSDEEIDYENMTFEDIINSIPEEDRKEAQEALEDVKATSEDGKYIFTSSDNSQVIYYHDGTNITGYEIRVSYETKEEAELAQDLPEITEDEEIESTRIDGTTLIIKYKPSAYEFTSLEDIQLTYSIMSAN